MTGERKKAPGPGMPRDVRRSAVFDRSGAYRYVLTREWSDGGGPERRAAFILLNPSTADAERDDPTIRRCMGFARGWGYTRLDVLNLFAYRATRPEDLRRAASPVGAANQRHVRRIVRDAELVLLAWGVHGAWLGQDLRMLALLRRAGIAPNCLGCTQGGHPRHVLYLPGNLRPQPFREATAGSDLE